MLKISQRAAIQTAFFTQIESFAMTERHVVSWIAAVLIFAGPLQATADEIDDQLQTIATCGPGGQGSGAAKQAALELVDSGIEILPRLLDAMDTDNILAANWYRTIYEQVTRRELKKTSPQFPLQSLRKYVQDAGHQGRSRRLVLGLLDRLDPKFRDRFIATQIADAEFRNDAITALLKQGDEFQEAGKTDSAARVYETAFRAARESGLIQTTAAKLKSIGREVSIIDHMGLVIDWHVLGPFDAPGKSGFDTVFPPEETVDLQASYAGQNGREISWKRFRTTDKLGNVNLVTAIAPVEEAVGYAYTEILSPRDQDVQLRCGADDNLSVWVNGEKVFARRQWLNGTRLDRFTAPVHLKSGKNTVLVKICQGPQHKNPAVGNNWSMQLRFCDKDGASVGTRSALPELSEKNVE
ncbi:hypothetical protein [Symmachiella dynata]|uniref:hypothetical protein n=1 Tax=Symmachiella dynata TaxID=2527995 RepID=UPI00119EC0D9|nr:hypothetical protein [Symmachiella dynata]